jgi:3-phenylpropionate/trans-cinnamate dioxygenase ferredoxin reductase component
VIVVGSGPAGVAAAESFREHDTRRPVRIFTADIDLPYARPPLSKEISARPDR